MKNPAKPTNKPGGKGQTTVPATNPENTAPVTHRGPGGRFKKPPAGK